MDNQHSSSSSSLPPVMQSARDSIAHLLTTSSPTTMTGFDLFARDFLVAANASTSTSSATATANLLFERARQLSDAEKLQYAKRAQQIHRFNRLSAYKCFLVDEQRIKQGKFRENKALEKWNAMEPLRKKRWQALADTQSTLKRKQLTGFQLFTKEYFAQHRHDAPAPTTTTTVEEPSAFKRIQRANCDAWKALPVEAKQEFAERAKLLVVPPKVTHRRAVSGWDLFRKESLGKMPFKSLLVEWSRPEVQQPYLARAREVNRPKDEGACAVPAFKLFKMKTLKQANAEFRARLTTEDLSGPAKQQAFWANMSHVMRDLSTDFAKMSDSDKLAMQREHMFAQKLKRRSKLNRGFYYD